MVIPLPQTDALQILSVFEDETFAFTGTVTFPPEEMLVSHVITTPLVGDPGGYAATTSGTTVSISGKFQNVFINQSFKVLDWKSESGYVLPKVYSTYSTFTDTLADLNWDNIISFTPDPRATVIATFLGTVVTEKPAEDAGAEEGGSSPDPSTTLPPIITTYQYTLNVVVNQQFDKNKVIIAQLVERGATGES